MGAATPGTMGVAIDVPLKLGESLTVPALAAITLIPGAMTSGLTRSSPVGPTLENQAR